jgi:mRNA interferase YafQ
MRTVRYTKRFQRDYKREQSGIHGKRLDALLMEVVDLLAADGPLPPRNRDHALSGEWSDCRDCHLRPDLVLIYRKPDADSLELVRLGSHSELGL